MTLASIFMTAGGIALAAATGPVGVVFGFGFMSGGYLSLTRSLRQDCEFIKWLTSSAIGFAGGLCTGGVAVGATDLITGAGAELATAIVGQQVGIGAIIGASIGITNSIACDTDKVLVDEEPVTAA